LFVSLPRRAAARRDPFARFLGDGGTFFNRPSIFLSISPISSIPPKQPVLRVVSLRFRSVSRKIAKIGENLVKKLDFRRRFWYR